MLINLICHTKSKSVFFVYQKTLKRTFKTGFRLQNPLFNLCFSDVNSQRLWRSQRADVKCSYVSFLVEKNLKYLPNENKR